MAAKATSKATSGLVAPKSPPWDVDAIGVESVRTEPLADEPAREKKRDSVNES